MKKIFLMMLMVTGSLFSNNINAQVSVNVGLQPAWGPTGYDYVDYYYLPDVGAYYFVPKKQFIYLNNGTWVHANALPARYRTYNLYSGYKVVINEPKPYLKYARHKVVYAKYRGNHGKQIAIKNAKEPKYIPVQKAGLIKSNAKSKGKNKHL